MQKTYTKPAFFARSQQIDHQII